MSTPRKRVTLADIAAETGYTINTVSHALKEKPDIAPATRRQIQQVAARLGYVRNDMASALRSGRSQTIAVIAGAITNPFYAVMIDALYRCAEKMSYTQLVMCSDDGAEKEAQAVATAVGRQVDGVLLCSCGDSTRSVAMLRQAGVPFVMISRRPEDGAEYDCVLLDEMQAGYLAARHLIERGNERIGFLYRYQVAYSLPRRLEGVRRAARDAGAPEPEVYRRESDEQTLETLRVWRGRGVTGIVVFCDIEALQLVSLLREAGMDGDFSLIGFDNIERVLGLPTPLCTVDGSLETMAQKAFERLDQRIRGDSSPCGTVMLPARVVCRGSCRRK